MGDREIQKFQQLSIQGHDKPSLPGYHDLVASTQQARMPPVSHGHPQTTFYAQPHFLPKHQHHFDHHAYHMHNSHPQGWAHASVESIPVEFYSSDRGNGFESSISSSSRESSAYPHGSVASSAHSTTIRTIRKKRGSDRAESGSDRCAKRPSMGLQSEDADDRAPVWCTKCDAEFRYCVNEKKHTQEAIKIRNEQRSRRKQAAIIQLMEDDLELSCGWKADKGQWTGNQNSSGLTGDKYETMETSYIRSSVLERIVIKHSLENEANGLFSEALDAHRANGANMAMPACSLMAAHTPTGERPCPGANTDNTCSLHGTEIQCRKSRRAEERCRNVRAINPQAKIIAWTPTARPCQSASRSEANSGSSSGRKSGSKSGSRSKASPRNNRKN